eukprot:scaffold11440_cov136-Isochrysis_galbana.AAC.3
MCAHHRATVGPKASWVSTPNLGSIFIRKQHVGNTAQSAAVGAEPHRYGPPYGATIASSARICLTMSSMAARRVAKRPNGGNMLAPDALYRQPWIGAMYRS